MRHLSGGTRRLIGIALLVAVTVAATVVSMPAVAATRSMGHTWFVRAGAHGVGRADSPFGNLAAVENASKPGDRIVVLPSTAPLNGGITLKRGQRLIGAGPSVLNGRAMVPWIENTSAASQHGDAVELADGVTVANLKIGPAVRGGIYGKDITGTSVLGNDLSGTNTSCTLGFTIASFKLPTLVPQVGVPFSQLTNGWAAIMLDATSGRANNRVVGNLVHDVDCADGIDVRAMGSSNVTATVAHNTLTRLREGTAFESILAIGMQTLGTATLHSEVVGNTETYIGSEIVDGQGVADSEGLFANSGGHSRLVEHAAHNTFAHGLGHLSANCFEAAASEGGPTMEISFDHSSCDTVPGDIIEADNLGANDTMTFKIDHVTAERSNWIGAPVQEQIEPGDDGDCILEVASAAGSSTSLSIAHSRFGNCAADGLGVVANAVGGGTPIKALHFSIEDSTFDHVVGNDLRVAWATPVASLEGRVEHSRFGASGGAPILLESLATALTPVPLIDLGGGALHSPGDNCILTSVPWSAEAVRVSATAKHDWWGRVGGPASILGVGGTIDTSAPLAAAPAGC